MDVNHSPVAPRRRLGAELRRLREAANKSVEDAAKVLECSASKISRLETGKGVPRARDVRDLIALYGPAAEAERERLLRWTSEGQGQGWWNDYRDVIHGELLADHLLRYVALESDATAIHAFEPEIVHGLLQTEDYTRALAELFFPDSPPDDRDRFVEFRMQRQQVLRRGDRSVNLHVSLGEAALRNPFGGADVMRHQLEHLQKIADEEGAVSLSVLPSQSGLRAAIGGPFAVLIFDGDEDQDVVYLEGREGANYLEKEDDVHRYLKKFGVIEANALGQSETVAKIEEELRNQG